MTFKYFKAFALNSRYRAFRAYSKKLSVGICIRYTDSDLAISILDLSYILKRILYCLLLQDILLNTIKYFKRSLQICRTVDTKGSQWSPYVVMSPQTPWTAPEQSGRWWKSRPQTSRPTCWRRRIRQPEIIIMQSWALEDFGIFSIIKNDLLHFLSS